MAGPQIEKQTDRHEPEILAAHAHLHRAVIIKPGKQFIAVYPTIPFFGEDSSSLSTLRFVPRSIASVMALLYAAKSSGEVSSSTSSSVSGSSGASLFLRLWMRMD